MPRGVRKERPNEALAGVEPYVRTKTICDLLDVSPAVLTGARKAGLPHLQVGREYRYQVTVVLEWFQENGKYLGESPEENGDDDSGEDAA